jgi:uncharacterized protein
MQNRLKRSYRVASELARNDQFAGAIDFSDLTRLGEHVLGADGAIEVEFAFVKNDFDHPLLRGRVRASLQVECQRCLEPMKLDIDQALELLIDASDADIEAYDTDSVYTDQGYLDLFEIVEDELMLAMPLIHKHSETDCNPYWQPQDSTELSAEPVNTPFAALGALKGTD